MFQLLKCEKNPLGWIDVIIEYDKPSKPDETVRVSHTALDDDKANIYINNAMKRYGYEWLKKYVNHKEIICRESDSFRKHLGKLSSIEKCKSFLSRAQVMGIIELANGILSIYEDLKNILPDINNTSYSISVWNLQNLEYWSHEVIKHRHSN